MKNEFRSLAAEAHSLCPSFVQLSTVEHLCQGSLDEFTSFLKAMERAVPSDSVSERVRKLKQKVNTTTFTWVSRVCFEKHALIASTQLCLEPSFLAEHLDYLAHDTKKRSKTSQLQRNSIQFAGPPRRLLELHGCDLVSEPLATAFS
jgi:hypothetical protein